MKIIILIGDNGLRLTVKLRKMIPFLEKQHITESRTKVFAEFEANI